MQLAKKKNRTILQVAAQLERMCEKRQTAINKRSQALVDNGEAMHHGQFVGAVRFGGKTAKPYDGRLFGRAVRRADGKLWQALVCAYCYEEFLHNGVGTRSVHVSGSYPETLVFPACDIFCERQLELKANRIHERLEAECKALTRARNLLSQARKIVKEKLHPSPLPSQRAESEPQTTLHA